MQILAGITAIGLASFGFYKTIKYITGDSTKYAALGLNPFNYLIPGRKWKKLTDDCLT